MATLYLASFWGEENILAFNVNIYGYNIIELIKFFFYLFMNNYLFTFRDHSQINKRHVIILPSLTIIPVAEPVCLIFLEIF